MKRKLFLAALSTSLFAGGYPGAVPVLVNEEKGIALNVGVLLQPQFQLTMPAGSGEGSPGIGAPDGKSPSFDFFLRRARLMVYGSVSKELSFFVETDQPNFGKGGAYNQAMIIQDAFMTYTFAPEFKIDAGMMLVPFSHHSIEGAVGLHTLDYHAEMLRFPAGLIFRDFGVQFRGLVADSFLHYRVGIFEGVRNGAETPVPVTMPPTPPRPTFNDNGLPRIVPSFARTSSAPSPISS